MLPIAPNAGNEGHKDYLIFFSDSKTV